MKWKQFASLFLLLFVLQAGCGSEARDETSGGLENDIIPSFSVDPSWPLELPNNWILGSVTGVFVDQKEHIWVTHLPETLTTEEISAVQEPPIGTCCAPAPVVIEFDQAGQVVQAWGESSQDVAEFPRNPHGIFVDHND